MKSNSKVIGSFVIGLAMVAGSYVITHFGGSTRTVAKEDAYAIAAQPESRTYISATDNNQNGIEDWQEEFVTDAPLEISSPTKQASSTYVMPSTVTDQMGIQLFQAVMESKARGNVGPDKAKIIADTATLISKTAIKDTIYNTKDITIIESSPEAIRTYANTLAEIIINNDVPAGTEGELPILKRATQLGSADELKKLDPIISMYQNLRDKTLKTPVPRGFEKQHLDLINVYQGMFATLDGMKLVFTDPVVSLLRIKRYQEDATGLSNALTNMYNALVPYANLLQPNDPAFMFAQFAPAQ
jgi:hypothetical protein